MKITIKGKEYNFDFTGWWGPQYQFEEIMNVAQYPERRFNPNLTLHMHVMFYCVLLCDNDGLELTLDEFFEALNDLTLANALSDFYARRCEVLTKTLIPKKEPKKESKKKR